MRLTVTAPAKINLHLRIVGRRSDGYYELRTLFQSIDLADEVSAESAPDGVLELRVEPQGRVTSGEDNLVLCAASLLRKRTRAAGGARIRLDKRVPVGAGLGGGSADAAATLVLLNDLWHLGLGMNVLTKIASELGSDVPFFLHGGLAHAVGRGEVVEPLPDLRPYGVLVVMPQIQAMTAEVFGAVAPRLTWERQEATVDAFVAGESGLPWGDLCNDLQPVVVNRWPEVARVLEVLRNMQPLHAAVTGSGAAVFAIFPDAEAARTAARGLDAEWRIHEGRTLAREQARLVTKKTGVREENGS